MMIRRYFKTKYLEEFRSSGRLRVGTFSLYRDIENKQIKDADEGRQIYRINRQKRNLSEEYLNNFFQDSNIKINSNSKNKKTPLIRNHGGKIDLGVTLPNAFILSFSAGDEEEMLKKFNVDSYFEVSDSIKFGNGLISQINKQYGIGAYCFDWVQYATTKNFDIGNTWNNVKFLPKPGEILNITKIRKYFWSYFTKDEKFKDEKEFRFVFLCEANDLPNYIYIKLNKGVINNVCN